MAQELYKVVTTDGATVNQFGEKKPYGIDENTAKQDAAERNKRAEEMGLKVRYEVAPV